MAFVILFFIGGQMITILPLSMVKFTGLLMNPANLTSIIPAFKEFQKFRSLTKIAAMKDEQISYIFFWILLFCASVAQFGGIIVAIDMHRVLLQRKTTLTTKTYNLQKMLQKALLVNYALIIF
uniref:Uncharacterized protein n=1 Tax=Acrobeloides nanus TaxID=290746 RepID=A0A914CIV8_9BILA